MKRARLHRSLWQEAGRAFRAAIRSSRNSGQVPGAASGLRFPNQTCRVRPKNGCGLKGIEEINAAPLVHRWRKFEALEGV